MDRKPTFWQWLTNVANIVLVWVSTSGWWRTKTVRAMIFLLLTVVTAALAGDGGLPRWSLAISIPSAILAISYLFYALDMELEPSEALKEEEEKQCS